MKKYRILASLVAAIAVSFAFVGFQCSSAELTSAKLYMQRSEWNQAEVHLEKEVQNNPQDEEAWYLLGRVRAEKQNWSGMLDAFQHALKLSDVHKKDIDAVTEHYWVQFYNTGTKYLQTAKDSASYYGKAIAAFNTAILLEPDSAMNYRGLAYTYLNMGATDSAIAPLTTLWTNSKDKEAGKFLGEIYFENGEKLKQDFENDNSDKLNNLKKVTSIEKGMSEEDVASTLGQPDQKKTEEPPKVKGRAKVIGKTLPKEIWIYKTYGLTLTFEDNTLKEKQVDFVYNPDIDSTKYQLALVQFNKALDILIPANKLYPEDQSIMTELTNCYIAADKTDQAAEAFKIAAAKNPDNKDFQYNYGVILLKSNDFAGAISQFEKTLKIDPEYWNAVYNLGATYVNWGVQIQDSASQNSDPDSLRKAVSAKFEKALPALEKFASHKSNDPNLWELLAKVYAYLNNVQKAQEAIQKADSLRQVH
ncbi:MAG: tetratricopeptide repeat protein [Bacteroidetes bacterium]|nr:tetratricopeptide repeat protein [Bacteroidota bacterium]MCL5738909.1 tetratricopeptide repeat protein [Bacteroidota bacterium]